MSWNTGSVSGFDTSGNTPELEPVAERQPGAGGGSERGPEP